MNAIDHSKPVVIICLDRDGVMIKCEVVLTPDLNGACVVKTDRGEYYLVDMYGRVFDTLGCFETIRVVNTSDDTSSSQI